MKPLERKSALQKKFDNDYALYTPVKKERELQQSN